MLNPFPTRIIAQSVGLKFPGVKSWALNGIPSWFWQAKLTAGSAEAETPFSKMARVKIAVVCLIINSSKVSSRTEELNECEAFYSSANRAP